MLLVPAYTLSSMTVGNTEISDILPGFMKYIEKITYAHYKNRQL